MMILTAMNVTIEGLTNSEGLSEYDVWVGINHRKIWLGKVEGHVRKKGAATLLRLIADRMEQVDSL